MTSVFGVFSGQGSQVTGTIHLDDAFVSGPSSTPNFDWFRSSSNPALDMFMRIQVGAVAGSTEGNANPPFTAKGLQQHDGPTADIWLLEIPPDLGVSMLDSEGRIELRTDGVSNALLPGSGGLDGSLLVPILGNFQSATGFFGERAVPSTGVTSSVFFNVTALTFLPEPSTAATAFAALAALALVPPRRRQLSRKPRPRSPVRWASRC